MVACGRGVRVGCQCCSTVDYNFSLSPPHMLFYFLVQSVMRLVDIRV